MKLKYPFRSFNRFRFDSKFFLSLILVALSSSLLSSCGGSDAKPQVKKFCGQVKAGESVMKVVARAGKVEFDKYWLEKFDKQPSQGEILGIIRPRDLEKKTEKLEKLKHPETWEHGRFNAMIQELGYARHVCTVDFSRDKVLNKKVVSVK